MTNQWNGMEWNKIEWNRHNSDSSTHLPTHSIIHAPSQPEGPSRWYLSISYSRSHRLRSESPHRSAVVSARRRLARNSNKSIRSNPANLGLRITHKTNDSKNKNQNMQFNAHPLHVGTVTLICVAVTTFVHNAFSTPDNLVRNIWKITLPTHSSILHSTV